MWELICHHTYKWQGLPVDLSPYGSDGVERGVEFLPDGASPGSGALHFPYNASVSIARSDAWSPLGAVRVETIVRYNGELSHVQPILDADNSFTFEANDGFLFALVWDKHPSQPGAEHVNLNTRDHGLSSPGYRLPLNQWTRVVFEHDGFVMRLFADGEVVTERRVVDFGVRGVGMRGIRIGNTLEGNDPFAGDIDEIKVWRLDPYERQRQFVSRPMDEATAECWERYLLRMRMALRENPDCASFVSNLEAAFNRVLRAIVSKSAGSEAKLFELRRRYNELWHKGTISGPEMSALMQEMDALLRDAGVALDSDPAINEIAQSPCLKRLLDTVGPLDCDPTYSALVQSVADAVALPQRKRSTAS